MIREFEWKVGDLPFLWRPLDGPSNPDGLPDMLDFRLIVDPATGVISQAPSAQVRAALARAYERGSVVPGLMEDSGIGRRYADDFLDFILARDAVGPGRNRVLEIGCGTGYLLSRLKGLGADVVGIEPGAHGEEGAQRYGVRVVRDFFPSRAIEGQYDLILMYGVLEHIEQPAAFLMQVRELLSPVGQVILAVPDCGSYLAEGDPSILLHEHWSYFDRGSLADLMGIAGLPPADVRRAGFGGALYAHAARDEARRVATDRMEGRMHAAREFQARAESSTRRLARLVRDGGRSARGLGIYVPGRIVNALSMAGAGIEGCRFFDDNDTLHGTYYPGFDRPIESRAQLLERPTDQVVIMSRTFGPELARELRGALGPATRIETWGSVWGGRG